MLPNLTSRKIKATETLMTRGPYNHGKNGSGPRCLDTCKPPSGWTLIPKPP